MYCGCVILSQKQEYVHLVCFGFGIEQYGHFQLPSSAADVRAHSMIQADVMWNIWKQPRHDQIDCFGPINWQQIMHSYVFCTN